MSKRSGLEARVPVVLAAAAVLLSGVPSLWAQADNAAQGPVYKIGLGARIVAEDVTVTDVKGNPITGLPQSAFHLTDNGKAQTIDRFDESTKTTETRGTAAAASTPGVYGNAALNRNQGTVTVLLVDPIGLELQDQMYLRLQMLKYLKTMPEGTQAIVFRSTSRGTPVLLQSLTADRGLLIAALDRSVPTQPRPVYSVYGNAIDELANMAEYLRNVPGKKALLWFAGKFPLYVQPDFGTGGAVLDSKEAEHETREAYRALEAARIAVYPIDARGVVMGGIALNQASDTAAAANDPSQTTQASGSESQQTTAAYDVMDKLAAATGGRAFYSNNNVAKAMGDAIQTQDHAYALSYRPTPYEPDGTWHRVKLTVDGGYRVRYREGYYADGATEPTVAEGDKKPRLAISGARAGSLVAPPKDDEESIQQAITFSARIKPEGSEGKRHSYGITYLLPTKTLDFKTDPDGKHHARFRVAAVGYNADGDILSKDLQVIETHFTNEQMTVADRGVTPVLQTITVPKGAEYLMLAVQDLDTQRVGVVQMSIKSVEAGAK